MNQVKILSINVSKPIQVQFHNQEVSTGIFKTPVHKSLFLSWLNFEGDGQADLVHHGGKEKAVCVYPFEHYPYWENELKKKLEYGAFGENLTTQGLLETDVCIGDIFELDNAIVQVSQPRQPCYKLSVKYGKPELPLKVQKSGYTGFYCRVLKEGMVSNSAGFTKIYSHTNAITVSFANQIMHREKGNIEGIKKILEVEELSLNWRKTFLKRLKGDEVDSRERLTGNK
ncbi:MOSC domain-containing protein [Siminovitchia terrae]|uniref:MOSC domain-containing protein n=1 Tax=Siminovitchia terrae TaxID=1914933 RepID=A0ABQ4KVB4_SIMTE|nr:MOSC domain-containing protein [Siminovitchia terrae]GIN95978.1 MOSC domain-containing protein [Siminovitchia terrae]